MTTDTDRLEHEVESHRTQVDTTLDELRDRMSVGQIVDEVSRYVKEGQGADMARNLGRQVRDNPLALALIGAGMAWLMVGQGARAEGRRLKDQYDDWRDEPDYDPEYDPYEDDYPGVGVLDTEYSDSGYVDTEYAALRQDGVPPGGGPYGAGIPGSTSYPIESGAAVDESDNGPGMGGPGMSGPGMSDRAKSAASHAASSLSGAASSVAGATGRAGHAVSGTAASAREAAARRASAARRGAYGAGRRVRRTFLDALYEEPVIMGGVAVAIGAAIGAALPATRREDELMGSARDRLRDDAYARGRDAAKRVEHVAERAYEAASAEAERKGLKPEGGSGETLAQKAGGVAGAARNAAQDEARKEGLT